MSWSLFSARGLVVALVVVGTSCEAQVVTQLTDGPCEQSGTIVRKAELNRDLLARFKVPEGSTASDESPLRIEAEVVRAEDRPPYMLRAFVFVPIQAYEHTSKDPLEAEKYAKLPFGKMDVVAPLRTKERFLLFPYEDAEPIRKRLKPGDVVFVGIEALPLTADDERLDVDVKVRRLISW